MGEQQKKNPGAATTATEAKSKNEAAKLRISYATHARTAATHFWDRHSNSVQPIAVMAPGACA